MYLNKIYNYCKLLKVDCIKKEFDEYLQGYKVEDISRQNGEWICNFKGEKEGTLILSISTSRISITKSTGTKTERMMIEENGLMPSDPSKPHFLCMKNQILEERENGFLYTVLEKSFAPSQKFQNDIVLTDLMEHRYVFTRDMIESFFGPTTRGSLFVKLYDLERKETPSKDLLKSISDYDSVFSTHMNCYWTMKGVTRKLMTNFYPTLTYCNGENVSSIFDVEDDKEKLYKVFDLYRGILNARNEQEVRYMNREFLSPDASDFKGLKGITEQEDTLIGKPMEDDRYDLTYLSQMMKEQFGYEGELQPNRASVLAGITYEISSAERTKRMIEKELGIPYSEFEQLDIEEQHRIIEQHTGTPIKPTCGFQFDFNTLPQLEEQMEDQLIKSSPKEKIKRWLDSFRKKK